MQIPDLKPRIAEASAIAILAMCCLAFAPSSQPANLAPDSFDFKALLGNPPSNDSQQHKDELDRMLQLQASRTPEEEARCQSEQELTVFAFSSVLGPWFNKDALPKTAVLMSDTFRQAKIDANAAKAIWNRPRPPAADSRIHPCVPLEKTASYPSSHAMRGMLWGTLLAEIFPDRRTALMTRGKQIGDDRFLAGMHYPSDVLAGQKLGIEIARRLLADPAFIARLQSVKNECLTATAAQS